MKRLRVLDLNTPWFWFTVFYQKAYGKPWLEMSLWKPNEWQKWRFHFWKWEQEQEMKPLTANSTIAIGGTVKSQSTAFIDTRPQSDKSRFF